MQFPARVPLQARSNNISQAQQRVQMSPSKGIKRTWQHAKLDENSKVALPRQATKLEADGRMGGAAIMVAAQDIGRRTVKRTKLEQTAAACAVVHSQVQRLKEGPAVAPQALPLRRWAQQYLKQFPSHVFYFDHCSDEDVRKCTKRIQLLDGNVEPFFSNKVNVVVTTREFTKDEHGRITYIQESGRTSMTAIDTNLKHLGNDVLVKAQALRIRVWSLKKLKDSVLKNLLAESQSQPTRIAPSLSHSLKTERTLGLNSENIKPFTGPFILCRDMTEVYRPIMMREWKATEHPRDGEWPQWRVTKFGRCPFQRDPSAEQSKYQGVATMVRPEKVKLPYDHINASGMVQITSAIQSNVGKFGMSNGLAGKEGNGSNAVASLHKKAVTSKRLPKMTATIEPVDAKKVKVEIKSGYCENCRDKFDSIEAHLKTLPHRQYASNEENFRELDALLQQLARVPLPEAAPL